MTIYIDEETGEQIDESELGSYDIVGDEPSFLESAWDTTKDIASEIWQKQVPTAEEVTNSLANIGLGFTRQAAKLDDYISDTSFGDALRNFSGQRQTFSEPTLTERKSSLFGFAPETLQNASEKATDYINQLEERNQEIAASQGAAPGSGNATIRNLLSESASFLPALYSGGVGFGLYGAGKAGEDLALRQQAGEEFTPEEELAYTGGSAAVNALGSRLVIPGLTLFGKTLPRRVISGATTNAALNPLFSLIDAGLREQTLGDELTPEVVEQSLSPEAIGSAAAQGAIFSTVHGARPVKTIKELYNSYKTRNVGSSGTEFPLEAVVAEDVSSQINKQAIEKSLAEVNDIIANAPERTVYKFERQAPGEVIEALSDADNTKKASKSKIVEAPTEEASKSFPELVISPEKAPARPEEFQALREQLEASKEGGNFNPDATLTELNKLTPGGKVVEDLTNLSPEERKIAKSVIREDAAIRQEEANKLPVPVEEPPLTDNLIEARPDLTPPLETDPDILAARKYLRSVAERQVTQEAPGAEQLDLGLKEVVKRKRIVLPKGGEGGFIRIGGDGAEDGPSIFKKARVAIKDFFTREGIEEAGRILGYETGKIPQTPESEKFFRGELFGANIPAVSEMRGWFRKKIINPFTVSDKFPNMKPVVDDALNYFKTRELVAADAFSATKPLFDLPSESTARVARVLYDARLKGDSVKLTPEALLKTKVDGKLLTEEEANAVLATRQTLDNLLLRYGEARVNSGMPVEDVESHLLKIAKENYVPLSRFGDLFISATKDGKSYFFTNETRKAHKLQLKALTKEGYKVESSGTLKAPNLELYEGLPFDFVGKVGAIDPDALTQISGFQQHLIQSKDVPGFSKDITRTMASYINSISNYIAKTEAKSYMRKHIDAIPPEEASLKAYALRYANDLFSNDTSATSSAIRKFLTFSYLGFNLKSAVVNGTQSLTTTLPNLMQYVSPAQATKILSSSMADATDFLSHEAGVNLVSRGLKKVGRAATVVKKPLSETDPELNNYLQRKIKDGTINAQMVRELAAYARGQKPGSAMDSAMYLFSAIETLNRATAEIAHYKAGRTLGKQGVELEEFADKGVRDTQFDYTKANRPEIFRGPVGSVLGVFRLFQGNYIRLLRNLSTVDAKHGIPFSSKKAIQAGGTALLTMGALGGVTAFPLWKILEYAMQRYGVDTKKAMREVLSNGSAADTILYGAPSQAGFSISGSLSPQDLNPDFSRGLPEAVGNLVGGAPLGYVSRVADTIYQSRDRDIPLTRAIENVAPEFIRNPMAAVRGLEEGWRSAGTNVPLVEKPSWYDLGAKALGFNPMSMVRANERASSIFYEKEKASDNKNINYKLALALFNNDQERFGELMKQAVKNGIKPNKTSIKNYYTDMGSSESALLRKLPKKAKGEGMKIMDIYRRR